MSKDAVIRVVDNDKTLTSLNKLRVRKTGGGYNNWVPEEEVQLTTKNISKNGTYKAKDDGKYGYSKVTVNVKGGNGSADSSGKPSTSPNAPKPGGSGSAVVGTDPTTGNDQVVGVDESGNLVTTTIPSAMHVITPPTNTTYNLDDTLDFTGLVCGLKKRDGSTFTDSRYPNGHIPMQELIFPVTKANQTHIPVRWESVYDGRTLADGFEIAVEGLTQISDLRNWLQQSWDGTIRYENGQNLLNVYTHGGYDRLYIDVAVNRNTNYRFSMNFLASSYQRGPLDSSYPDDPCIAVLSDVPGGTYIGRLPTLIAKSTIPNGSGECSVVFNSGNLDTAYLCIDLTGVQDGTMPTFTISGISITKTSGTTESSSGTEGSGGGGTF